MKQLMNVPWMSHFINIKLGYIPFFAEDLGIDWYFEQSNPNVYKYIGCAYSWA